MVLDQQTCSWKFLSSSWDAAEGRDRKETFVELHHCLLIRDRLFKYVTSDSPVWSYEYTGLIIYYCTILCELQILKKNTVWYIAEHVKCEPSKWNANMNQMWKIPHTDTKTF